MSRDEIVRKLYAFGAISLVHAIQDAEAGRIRHVSLPHIPGDSAFVREVVGFLRCMGAEVDPAAGAGGVRRLRRVG
ncbi:MAG TPA: hypothetical protein VJT32_12190 [bacterium]|nr:hypothetical protein [bacterium]